MKITSWITTAATLLPAILWSGAALSAQQAQPQPTGPEKAAHTAASSPSVPKGAVEVEPYTYRYTDTQGKTWMYHQSPFGVSKWEESKVSTPAPVEQAPPIRVTDLGLSIRFERTTPFGTSQWVHGKLDLTDEDKALIKAATVTPRTTSEKP